MGSGESHSVEGGGRTAPPPCGRLRSPSIYLLKSAVAGHLSVNDGTTGSYLQTEQIVAKDVIFLFVVFGCAKLMTLFNTEAKMETFCLTSRELFKN